MRQSVTESSFDAWTRFYKQDENAPNAIVSYYAKGALIALALDLTLRDRTDGACSLDDIMRALWQRHGKRGIGVAERGIEQLVTEISGLDLGEFFDDALYSTGDPELADLLARFGIELQWEAAAADAGYVPQFAAAFRDEGGFPKVVRLIEDGAGQRAGLAAGDRVVAIDGIHVPASQFAQRVARMPVGRPVPVHLLRDDRLLVRELELGVPARDQCRLRVVEDADHRAANRRSDWLGVAP